MFPNVSNAWPCSLNRSTVQLARALFGWYFSTSFELQPIYHTLLLSVQETLLSSLLLTWRYAATICCCCFWSSCSSSVLSSALCSSTNSSASSSLTSRPMDLPETWHAPLLGYQDHPQSIQSPLELQLLATIFSRRISWSYKTFHTSEDEDVSSICVTQWRILKCPSRTLWVSAGYPRLLQNTSGKGLSYTVFWSWKWPAGPGAGAEKLC